ncbi:Alpha-galactosidase AgaN, partial [human gut metagenome]
LDEDSMYKNEETNEVYSGGALMNAGINVTDLYGDYSGKLIHLLRL